MTQTPPPTAIETVSERLTDQQITDLLREASNSRDIRFRPFRHFFVMALSELLSRRSLDTADGVEPSERLNLHRKVIGMLHRGEKHAAVILSGRDLHVIAEALLDRAIDVEKASRTPNTETVVKDEPEPDDADRMQKISEVIANLQSIHERFGDTCVYIRRGGMSWGAVALNRSADDKKYGVFDLQAQHDRDMTTRLEQVQRLIDDNRELRAALASPPSPAEVRVTDAMQRAQRSALEMLRHLDEEIARVPSKPDPVTLNNLTYWAAQLRKSLQLGKKG